jgi:rhamnose utilization protein RhaD (predicted bifunctional aldolase and dehydrogenase)/NAD(P)-dependent dehydrogenase (short-subunit alcohol dehydrogenase family)
MENLWNESDAAPWVEDPVALRAYSSRLLGSDPSLVLHGGGNTSVKVRRDDFFGVPTDVLYVKGSGWDLATIEPAGFSPVRLDVLVEMSKMASLSDTDLVREQRVALLDPAAPNPSIEAVVHGLIPATWVDHTHADAVVAMSHLPDGEARLRELYGDNILILPYEMPGFILAKQIQTATRDVDWSSLDGIILLRHGVFTFAEDARTSYELMIDVVRQAEDALGKLGALDALAHDGGEPDTDTHTLARIRREVSQRAGRPMITRLDRSATARGFAGLQNVGDLIDRGPITPDHVIRTKRTGALIGDDVVASLDAYAADYQAYFAAHGGPDLQILDPAPRWAVWPGEGVLAFGQSPGRADQIADIARHTTRAIQWAEAAGGWRPLDPSHIFDVEYWELEQAKLRRGGAGRPLDGKIALVTGGAGGIGAASADALRAEGAAVCVLDIDPTVTDRYDGNDALGQVCDVTDSGALAQAMAACVTRFGGLDILVTNAGAFPPSSAIADTDDDAWSQALELNLTSHQKTLRAALPYLEEGLDPAVIVIGSKNVHAPGPGVSAYSAAKAGLTQLARVAALELGPKGIRVNIVHPDKVFDTNLWSEAKIAARAAHYGVTIDDYKRQNLLGVEVCAAQVGAMVAAMAGPLFASTTGAQVPLDGGNDRVV